MGKGARVPACLLTKTGETPYLPFLTGREIAVLLIDLMCLLQANEKEVIKADAYVAGIQKFCFFSLEFNHSCSLIKSFTFDT